MPGFGIAGLRQQITDVLRVITIIHLECIECGLDGGEVGPHSGLPGLFAAAHHLGHDQRGEDADDGDDQQHFDEREGAAFDAMCGLQGAELDFHSFI